VAVPARSTGGASRSPCRRPRAPTDPQPCCALGAAWRRSPQSPSRRSRRALAPGGAPVAARGSARSRQPPPGSCRGLPPAPPAWAARGDGAPPADNADFDTRHTSPWAPEQLKLPAAADYHPLRFTAAPSAPPGAGLNSDFQAVLCQLTPPGEVPSEELHPSDKGEAAVDLQQTGAVATSGSGERHVEDQDQKAAVDRARTLPSSSPHS